MRAAILLVSLAAVACGGRDPGPSVRLRTLNDVGHIVVIYLENRSFDNLYGEFPRADGLAAAADAPRQVDREGRPYATLPQRGNSPFPDTLPNAPFPIEQYVPITSPTADPLHRFYQEQMQIDGGRMDRFAAVSSAEGLVMGYYHTARLPLAAEARRYTLCDRFFHSAFGGSFLNHMWLVAAATPVFPGAPHDAIAQLDASGKLALDALGAPVHDGFVTPDHYVVNTAYPVNDPHPPGARADHLVPSQTMPTIGDRLSAKGVSWAWYAEGWDDAAAGHASGAFPFHHQPFVYFADYAPGTRGRAEHLKDEQDFVRAAAAGTLPAVSFVKPANGADAHPGTSLLPAERHAEELIEAVRNGPNWKDAVIIVTYDENGGFWDHIAPPPGDRWGPGTRVPTIIISPFARRGYVDHTTYETVSILALIEHRWGLAPLGPRDARAADLTGALRF